jgi:cytochrome c oxidase subunit 2
MSTPSPLDLWPVAASANAVEVDHVILAFTAVLLLLTVPIFVFMAYCAAKYRAGRPADRSYREARNLPIELSWMLIPFALSLIFFVWAARIYDRERHPPPDAMVITAVGRQWMWKFQHEGGQAEINDLHVPVNQSVRINMVSQDVVHALYIPALRIQMDAIPGRETNLWFKADQVGAYLLFCSEFCGTDHSKMAGTLYVMQPADYQAWLAAQGSPETLAAQGKVLFSSLGCSGCHGAGSTVRAPDLAGLYGNPVPLEGGGTAVADEGYIIDKILYPDLKPVAGYQQKMPSFEHKVSDADLLRLVAYIRTLGPGKESTR